MGTKTIKKEIDINAPKEQVWNTLFDAKNFEKWTADFAEGSHINTDWQVGSKVVFADKDEMGLVAKIVENKPNQEITIEYNGILNNGQEDTQSQEAHRIKGARENYVLSAKGNATHLSIASDTPEEMYDSMASAWDKALQKVKDISERRESR